MRVKILSLAVLMGLVAGCGGGGEGDTTNQPWLGGSGGDVDGGGDGSPENSLPVILGEMPAGISMSIRQSSQFSIDITDPDGDDLEVTLNGAPNWIEKEAGSNVYTATPDSIGTFGPLFFTVSDGKDTVTSDAFNIVVEHNEEWYYTVPLPFGTAEGDGFELKFHDRITGEVQEFSSLVEDGRAEIYVPYPLGSELSGDSVSLTWSRVDGFELSRYIGDSESLYSNLNASLTLPIGITESHTPTLLDRATERLVVMLSGGEFATERFRLLPESTALYAGSISAEALSELASYYFIADTVSELGGMKEVLQNFEPNYIAFDGKVPSELREVVNLVRYQDSSLVNERYWQDLLSMAESAIMPKNISWDSGEEWSISSPVVLGYASKLDGIISLNDEGFRVFGKGTQIPEGDYNSWEVEGSELVLEMPSNEGGSTVVVEVSQDPVVMRSRLRDEVHLDYETSDEWSNIIIQSGLEKVEFVMQPYNSYRINIIKELSSKDRIGFLTQQGEVQSESLDLKGSHYGVRKDVVLRDLSSPSYVEIDYRPQIFDIIIPMPDKNGDIQFNSPDWLDIYDAPSVSNRVVYPFSSTEGDTPIDADEPLFGLELTDWSISFDNKEQVLSLTNASHAAGDLSYKIKIVSSSAPDFGNNASIDTRRFAGDARVMVNGDIIDEGPVAMSLHAKSLCESGVADAETACDVTRIESELSVWYNSQNGSVSQENLADTSEAYLFYKKDDVDRNFFKLIPSSNCLGEIQSCWSSQWGEPKSILSFGRENHAHWFAEDGTESWFPIRVDSDNFSVWVPGGEVKHFESYLTTDETLEDALLCSAGKDNPYNLLAKEESLSTINVICNKEKNPLNL
jgi:hypothetical protein